MLYRLYQVAAGVILVRKIYFENHNGNREQALKSENGTIISSHVSRHQPAMIRKSKGNKKWNGMVINITNLSK